ncbi:transposase [Candidatus Poribacteria bacterium]|nr:transposase [Candidatus Poribacteria bacterium]
MSKKHSRRRFITNHNHETEILTYSVPLLTPFNKEILNTLFVAKRAGNYYLRKLFSKETVESLSTSNIPAYKILEPFLCQHDYYIPSRLNRGILEVTGRILRQQGDRESVFSALLSSSIDPTNWDFNLLLEKKNLYSKSQYIENIKEQTENYISLKGKFPASYVAMTKTPRLKRGMLSYAPDDGQALRFSTSQEAIIVEMKVAKTTSPSSGKDWEWKTFSLPLFEKISGDDFASFDLRCGTVKEKLVPILDIKVKVEAKETKETGNFIVVDWGLRKLITVCVFNRKGEQISPPFLLKWKPIQKKLLRIRKTLDNLKSKRDKLPQNSTSWRWYNREVAKHWNKFRQIQKQLSHLASNCIVEIAKIFQCDSIYVEWLKSLKSDSCGRETNWKINSTVRQALYEKVQYKALLNGISFSRPLPAGYSSQFCPKCGKKGHHVKAPDRLTEKKKSGCWFYCPHCNYNADRDYVACQNLARRALFGNKLKDSSKAFAYRTKAISEKLFRQSIENFSLSLKQRVEILEKLRHHLNGWKNSVFLEPVIERAGTLRL